MPKVLRQEDINRLAGILADHAGTFEAGPRAYFKKVILRANLPKNWQLERANASVGDPELDALELVNWAIVKGVNPNDIRLETLGSILSGSLKDLGLDEQRWVVALIAVYQL